MTTILRDASIIVNGSDLSHHSQQLAVDMTANTIETTVVGARGRSFEQGTIDGVFTVRFLQNLTVVHQVLQPLLATTFPVSVSIPGSPVFSMQAEMFRYQPITGVVGEVAGADVEFVGTIVITDPNATVTGVRAQATATGQSGMGVGSDFAYGSGVYGAGPYGGTFLLAITGVRASAITTARPGTIGIQPITGVQAAAAATARPGAARTDPIVGARGVATATTQPGGVGMLTPWVSANAIVIGVRASATATAQAGTVQIMPIAGVRAAATATAQPGFVAIMPIPGVLGSATATAQSGGVGMLTAPVGPVT